MCDCVFAGSGSTDRGSMSLYDDLGVGASDTKTEGWSKNFKLLQSQLKVKKAALTQAKVAHHAARKGAEQGLVHNCSGILLTTRIGAYISQSACFTTWIQLLKQTQDLFNQRTKPGILYRLETKLLLYQLLWSQPIRIFYKSTYLKIRCGQIV